MADYEDDPVPGDPDPNEPPQPERPPVVVNLPPQAGYSPSAGLVQRAAEQARAGDRSALSALVANGPQGLMGPPQPGPADWSFGDEKALASLQAQRSALQGEVENNRLYPWEVDEPIKTLDGKIAGLKQRQQAAQQMMQQAAMAQAQFRAQVAKAGSIPMPDGSAVFFDGKGTPHHIKVDNTQAKLDEQRAQFQLKLQQHQQDMVQKEQKHQQDLLHTQQQHQMKMEQDALKAWQNQVAGIGKVAEKETQRPNNPLAAEKVPDRIKEIAEQMGVPLTQDEFIARRQQQQDATLPGAGLKPGEDQPEDQPNWIISAARSAKATGDQQALQDLDTVAKVLKVPEKDRTPAEQQALQAAWNPNLHKHMPQWMWQQQAKAAPPQQGQAPQQQTPAPTAPKQVEVVRMKNARNIDDYRQLLARVRPQIGDQQYGVYRDQINRLETLLRQHLDPRAAPDEKTRQEMYQLAQSLGGISHYRREAPQDRYRGMMSAGGW